jgi:predicted DNA-binding transcriptional regulator
LTDLDEGFVESELKGKTLNVYWHLLRHGSKPMGVRDLQRTLGFSSPSVAFHHLEKLRRLGLLEKNLTGEYVLTQRVRVGVLKQFIGVGRLMLPRYLFYAVFFTAMLTGYLAAYPQTLTLHNIAALIFGAASCLVLWYETVRVYRQMPI